MNHLLAGALIPFAVAAVVYLARGCRASLRFLLLTPLAMFLGAVWAVIPDLPRIIGWHTMDRRLASTQPWIDIFVWHYTINSHETPSPWYSVGFVVMMAALLAVAWRELRRMEEH